MTASLLRWTRLAHIEELIHWLMMTRMISVLLLSMLLVLFAVYLSVNLDIHGWLRGLFGLCRLPACILVEIPEVLQFELVLNDAMLEVEVFALVANGGELA